MRSHNNSPARLTIISYLPHSMPTRQVVRTVRPTLNTCSCWLYKTTLYHEIIPTMLIKRKINLTSLLCCTVRVRTYDVSHSSQYSAWEQFSCCCTDKEPNLRQDKHALFYEIELPSQTLDIIIAGLYRSWSKTHPTIPWAIFNLFDLSTAHTARYPGRRAVFNRLLRSPVSQGRPLPRRCYCTRSLTD